MVDLVVVVTKATLHLTVEMVVEVEVVDTIMELQQQLELVELMDTLVVLDQDLVLTSVEVVAVVLLVLVEVETHLQIAMLVMEDQHSQALLQDHQY